MNYKLDEIKPLIIESLKKNNVKRAGLFGSVVRGEATDKSDIDILVEFTGNKSLLDLVGLKLELEDILKCKVDILTYNSIHPLLKKQILDEQVIII